MIKKKQTLDRAELEYAARILHALAHPVRLHALQVLQEGEKTVTELYTTIGCSQSMMSQQLRILEEQRLIATRKEEAAKYCRVANNDFLNVFHCVKCHLGKHFRVEGR